MTTANITLHLPSPTTAAISETYTRLALGVAQHLPGLLQNYRSPTEWQTAISAEPPSLEALRQQAVEVATTVQQSQLPRNRRDWLLRQTRALLWLIRTQTGEEVIFSEQVRLLLDVPPESAEITVFEMAHDTLDTLLPGSDSLVERWAAWQAKHTRPTRQALPLLQQALDTLVELLGSNNPLLSAGLPSLDLEATREPVGYQHYHFYLPVEGVVRVDRLYHLAAQAIAWHRLNAVASPIQLKRGPEQIIRQGLPQALLTNVDIYSTVLPTLLAETNLSGLAAEEWRALHLAEDALAWAEGNVALLLHSEGLRPRALRRHLMSHALLSQTETESCLARLAQPIEAAHVFAPLIGGPLLTAWLAHRKHSLTELLSDPPVPSRMLFDVQTEQRRQNVNIQSRR
jgi:hypothetical protein